MRENILLVEDEEALCMALSDRLRKEGYVVDLAADGEVAFEKATTLPFDLIILDIMLPGRNGLDLCRDIRIAGLGTPILVLTARSETSDKVVGLKLGADDYVTKPFDMMELMARIEALLRRAPVRSGQAVYQFGSIRIETRAALDHRDVKVTRSGEPVYLPFVSLSSCATSWSTRALFFPERSSYARCGATKWARSHARWTYMSPVCVRNWRKIRRSPN